MSKIMDRAKKMWNLSVSAEGAEAETAARMLRKLMEAHAIEMDQLDDYEMEDRDPLIRSRYFLRGLSMLDEDEQRARAAVDGKPWYTWKTANWKRKLFYACAGYLGLKATYRSGHPTVTVYGHLSDVKCIADFYRICALQIERKAQAVSGRERGAFRSSAVWGLQSLFGSLKRTAAKDSGKSSALVIARERRVAAWYDQQTVRIRTARYSAAGYNAGRKLQLHRGEGVGKSVRKQLSKGE